MRGTRARGAAGASRFLVSDPVEAEVRGEPAALMLRNASASLGQLRRRRPRRGCSRSIARAASAPRGLLLLDEARLLISKSELTQCLLRCPESASAWPSDASLSWRSGALAPARSSNSESPQLHNSAGTRRRLPL